MAKFRFQDLKIWQLAIEIACFDSTIQKKPDNWRVLRWSFDQVGSPLPANNQFPELPKVNNSCPMLHAGNDQ